MTLGWKWIIVLVLAAALAGCGDAAGSTTTQAATTTWEPTPDPDPSVKPGTPQTRESYWIDLPVFDVDGRRIRGYHWHCYFAVHKKPRCTLVRNK